MERCRFLYTRRSSNAALRGMFGRAPLGHIDPLAIEQRCAFAGKIAGFGERLEASEQRLVEMRLGPVEQYAPLPLITAPIDPA